MPERHRREIIDAITRLIDQIGDGVGSGLGGGSQDVRHFSSLSFLQGEALDSALWPCRSCTQFVVASHASRGQRRTATSVTSSSTTQGRRHDGHDFC
jgi:hypothetical protein